MPTTQQLRSAARHAYYIKLDGSVPGGGGEIGPLVGYTAPPKAASAGDFGIDAGFVAPLADGVLISIRGTTPPLDPAEPAAKILLDWIQNTGALLVASGGVPPGFPGKVHFGFYQSYTKLWAKLWPLVSSAVAAHAKKTIFITGHSKGGAIAALIAWRLHKDFPDHQIKVRTFGAPRLADAAFAAEYNSKIDHIRYEYDEDLVPHLPVQTAAAGVLGAPIMLAAFLMTVDAGYGNVGKLAYINKAGAIVGPPASSDAMRVPLLLAKLAAAGGADYVFDCHGIAAAADGYVIAQYPD
jgi:hypothetical protein